MTVHIVLMLLAVVCFLLGAVGVVPPRNTNWIAFGLCLWALATLITV